MNNRTQLIKLIHVGKRELTISDDVYRLLLRQVTGKTSCKDMNISELEQVLRVFRTKGFQRGFSSKKHRSAKKTKTNEILKIQAIWEQMVQQGFIKNDSPKALNEYDKRMTASKNHGQGVAKLEWLDSNSHL